MSTNLALYEPTALEALNRRGSGLVRLLSGMIPEVWSTAAERMVAYEKALLPYVGSEYSKNNVKAALQDERLGRTLVAVTEATLRIEQKHSALARIPTPAWLLVPFRAYLDHNVRARVSQTMSALKEATASMRRAGALSDPRVLTAVYEHSLNVTAFLHDPDVPTEVAKRLLAGLRARITMDMIQVARRNGSWEIATSKRALLDWSEDLLSAIGYIASQPGISIRALPREYQFDLRAVLEQHRRRRQRLAADAREAAHQLKK